VQEPETKSLARCLEIGDVIQEALCHSRLHPAWKTTEVHSFPIILAVHKSLGARAHTRYFYLGSLRLSKAVKNVIVRSSTANNWRVPNRFQCYHARTVWPKKKWVLCASMILQTNYCTSTVPVLLCYCIRKVKYSA